MADTIIRTVRFVLPEHFCIQMDKEARDWADRINRTPTKAIREAYIKRYILDIINQLGEEDENKS